MWARRPERSTTSSRSRANYYGTELEYRLKKLMALMEPAVIIFMGLIVGFVAVAMVQSIYGMMQGSELK